MEKEGLRSSSAASPHKDPCEGESPDLKADLSLMQTAYTILLVLGYRQLGDSLFDLFRSDKDPYLAWSLFAYDVALTLFGLRFFWSVGNIRRFVIRTTENKGAVPRRTVTVFLFPALFFHAMLFYFNCRMHSEFIRGPADPKNCWQLISINAAFLTFNASWLAWMIWSQLSWKPESLWIKNNLACAMFLVATSGSSVFWNIEPWQMLAVASGVLVMNALIDGWFTAHVYVTGYRVSPRKAEI